MVANRLKVVLPSLISESQSEFVPERHITDNILVVYEVIQFLRRKTKSTQSFMSLKLNMNKAYDHVKWDYLDYLEGILKVFGFPTITINLIIQCKTMTSFFVLINGVPKGLIVPSRGLRQRDPLSSYLFLLCIKGLVNLLNHSLLNKSIMGIRVCRGLRPLIIYFLLTIV